MSKKTKIFFTKTIINSTFFSTKFFFCNWYDPYFKKVIRIAERTINDEIQHIVDTSISQMPRIEVITVNKIHDSSHIDVKLENGNVLEYIPVIANNLTVGNVGLLIPLQNDEFYVISKWYLWIFWV